jgi:uncharacterized membrane protein YpjA
MILTLFRWLRSPAFLLDKRTLLLLILVNGAGTVYGYMWYGNQLAHTAANMSPWLLPFVPDSPTASLLFTFSLLWMYGTGDRRTGGAAGAIRGIVDALAVVTSVKYGIWAVVMIVWGWSLGDAMVWEQWMLIVSHLGMAVEALLYARFMQFRLSHLAVAAAWTIGNDVIDYRLEVYPWLPRQLTEHLPLIERVTNGLSLLGIAAAFRLLPARSSRLRTGQTSES